MAAFIKLEGKTKLFGKTIFSAAAAISNWILATGLWRDIGVWDDSENWKDA